MKALFALALLLSSCGVEVGNPTKPVDPPPPQDTQSLALAAAQQYEETVDAGAENYDSSESDLLLLPLGSCISNLDGTVTLKFEQTRSLELKYPRKAPLRSVKRESSKTVSAVLSSADELLLCLPGGRAPLLNWLKLSSLKVESQANRSEKRQDVDLSSAEVLADVNYTVDGTRTLTWTRKTYEDKVLTAEKSLSFASTLLSSGASVTVKTAEDLVIEQKSSRGTLSSFVIRSGSVLSDYKDDQQMRLTYKELAFSSSGSCHPSSGTVDGVVYPKTGDATATVSFQLIFVDGEAHLQLADGTEQAIILQDCALN